MATLTAAPGQFLNVYAQAQDGDTIEVYGDQNLGGRWINNKHLTLKAASGGIRARLIGAITDEGELNIDFSNQPPPLWLMLDDTSPIDSVFRPSWIIGKTNTVWRGVEMTNHNSKIGLSPTNYGGVGGAYFDCALFYIHDVGRLFSSSGAAGAEWYLNKYGKYVGNHDHGYYGSGIPGVKLADGLIERCSDRGLQVRAGASSTYITRVLVRDCGQGVIFGDGNNNTVTKSIFLDNNVNNRGRTLLEEYQPGTGNKVDDVFAWNADGRAVSSLSAVALTNLHHTDPQYDPTTKKLMDTSPAIGYGPSWIQPAINPTPTPTPTPTNDPAAALTSAKQALTDANTALTELKATTSWSQYGTKTTTHTYKCGQALMKAISDIQTTIKNLGG